MVDLRALAIEPPPREESESEEEGPLTVNQVLEQTHEEYERVQKELKEIDMLIKQSSSEVEKLAQRNAQWNNKVRTMESNIDTLPRQDIKETYRAAQDSQMRLFMMRGQMEQLQNKREILGNFANMLHRILEVSSEIISASESSSSGPAPKRIVTTGENGESSGIVKIIDAQERERQHLSIRLHDGPAQSLTNLILQAEICERLFDSDPVRARGELTELKEAVTGTFQKVREFIFDLRPMMLDDLGLPPTLKKITEDYEQKTGIACNLSISGNDSRLPPHVEVTIFRVIQQLLNNVRDHAQATHVQVSMNVDDDQANVSVEDDGAGFDVEEKKAASRQRKTIGLSTIEERVDMLGGELTIDSSPGRGTRVDFWLPIDA